MQKRILPLAVIAVLLISLIGWNCTKLDTTDIGSDLLPAVDNVNTFADTLLINSTQGYFDDSTTIGKYDDYAVGRISNDPLFGPTTANIYVQLKPPFYPYYYGNPGDTIVAFDSIVLCLKYKGFWGDSLLPVSLEVKQVIDGAFRDSANNSNFIENTTAYQPNAAGPVLGSANIDVRTLGNYIKLNNGRDSVTNQIRIKLSGQWVTDFFNRDSIMSSGNNAFYNDTAYRSFYNGIAIIGTGGNGLLYASLSDTATKLEIHYKKKNGGAVDSVYSSFRLNPSRQENVANKPVSNTSNYIKRGWTGFPVKSPAASEHYIQTAPGTFVNLNIPGLAGLSNRIIHRAEIIVEQIPTDPVMDEKLSPPNFLYIDLKDTGAIKWKPIYFDLNTSEIYNPDNVFNYIPGQIDYQYFGGYRRSKTDPLTGNAIKFYTFNISRYVQQIVTEHTPVYDMRLYAPFNLNYPQHSFTFIPYGNNIAFGRVRIGSGSNPNYRLRLRIVWSKL